MSSLLQVPLSPTFPQTSVSGSGTGLQYSEPALSPLPHTQFTTFRSPDPAIAQTGDGERQVPARAPELTGSSETQKDVGPGMQILEITMSFCPLPFQKNSNSVFRQMPYFYSEAEATIYEVIFEAVFEAVSHWPAGEAPPWVPDSPPSLEPIKAHIPASAATVHLHQLTRLGAGEAHKGRASAVLQGGVAWGTLYTGDGAGLQVSAWASSQKATKTAKFDGLESGDQPG